MDMNQQRIEQLKQLLKLEEQRKDSLEVLAAMETRIATLQRALLGGVPTAIRPAPAAPAAPAAAPAPAPGKRRRRRQRPRGQLKAKIVKALAAAGPKGLTVAELATKLGEKAGNLHAWFGITGKKVQGLAKIGKGLYRLNAPTAPAAPALPPVKPVFKPALKPAAKPAPKKVPVKALRPAAKVKRIPAAKKPAAKPAKPAGISTRGATSAKILATLKAAGANGISIKEIEQKTGLSYGHLSVWFATTGKRNPAVKRAKPGVYRLTA